MKRPRRPAETLHVDRGSRFLALLAPAEDPEAARSVLAERSRDHADATHHCWAYRIWDDGEVRGAGFDAGEPAGTAGRPILGALERAEAIAAVCVVTRWFGGVKLGTGGLTRAYAAAARGALDGARESGALTDVRPIARLRVTFDYALTGPVEGVAAAHSARRLGADYGARTGLDLTVPTDRADALTDALVEATGGAIEIDRLDDALGPA